MPASQPEAISVSTINSSIDINDWRSDQDDCFTLWTNRSSNCAEDVNRKRARAEESEPLPHNKRIKSELELWVPPSPTAVHGSSQSSGLLHSTSNTIRKPIRREDQAQEEVFRYDQNFEFDSDLVGPPSDFHLASSVASSRLGHPALGHFDTTSTTSQAYNFAASMQSSNNDPSGAIGPSDARFEVELRARGARLADFLDTVELPSNLEQFKRVLAADRASPGPDQKAVRVFRQLLSQAASGAGVTQLCLQKALPCIEEAMLAQDQETVTDKQWSRSILLEPDRCPPLSACKPDQTFGWSIDAFPFCFDRVTQALKSFIRPVATYPSLHWPYFTVEAKGAKRTLREARLQNLHNGAVMLNNMLCMKEALGKEAVAAFLNKIHVASLELTTETIQISGYWASTAADGSIKFYAMTVGCWTPNDPEGIQFGQARTAALNAIAWMRRETHTSISSDMQAYEEKLAKEEKGRFDKQREQSEQRAVLTPPSSQSGKLVKPRKEKKRRRSPRSFGNTSELKSIRASQSAVNDDPKQLDQLEPLDSSLCPAVEPAETTENQPEA